MSAAPQDPAAVGAGVARILGSLVALLGVWRVIAHFWWLYVNTADWSVAETLLEGRYPILALVAVWAAVRQKPLVLVAVFAAGFVPEGLTAQWGVLWWLGRSDTTLYLWAAGLLALARTWERRPEEFPAWLFFRPGRAAGSPPRFHLGTLAAAATLALAFSVTPFFNGGGLFRPREIQLGPVVTFAGLSGWELSPAPTASPDPRDAVRVIWRSASYRINLAVSVAGLLLLGRFRLLRSTFVPLLILWLFFSAGAFVSILQTILILPLGLVAQLFALEVELSTLGRLVFWILCAGLVAVYVVRKKGSPPPTHATSPSA